MSHPAGHARLWRRDLRGGLNAALVALPICMSYGLLAFGPLGAGYTGMGVAAALLGAILVPLLCALFGLRAPQVFVARGVSTVILAAFMAEFANLPGGVTPLLAAQAALLFVFLIAILELAFSVAQVARVAKYLPAPVTAGFQCGVAAVLLAGQAGDMLGLAEARHVLQQLGEVHTLAPLIALVTIAVAVVTNRKLRRAPAFLLALTTGTLVHALLEFAGLGAALGPTVGEVPLPLPQFTGLTELIRPESWSVFLPILPQILGWALTAAVIATTESLINLKLIEDITETRIDASRELLRTGAANLVGALCGGLHAGVNGPSSFTAIGHGARGRIATASAAVALFGAAVLLAPVIAHIPKAAFAGVLILVALRMFDPWAVGVALRLARGELRPDRDLFGMLGIVAVVTGLALLWNFLVAVAAGLGIAVFAFIWRMSRSIIRRTYTGKAVQSRNLRAPSARDFLQTEGGRIVVFELEGPLFFGTAEKLVAHIDAAVDARAEIIIADLKRINDIDSTGARILQRTASRLARRNKHLFLAGVASGGRIPDILASFGIARQPQGGNRPELFQDVDLALEVAENILLDQRGDSRIDPQRVPLEKLDMLQGFTRTEVGIVARHLRMQSYNAGSVIFRAGDPGNALYAILSGRASVIIDVEGTTTRLSSISAGAFFGEIALLDRKPRSASVRADTEVECTVLDEATFELLRREHPECAIKLLTNLARELSARLRNNNLTIQSLAA